MQKLTLEKSQRLKLTQSQRIKSTIKINVGQWSRSTLVNG